MQALAQDEEQVAFWRRHTRLGVALCVVIPTIVWIRTWLLAAPAHPAAELTLSGLVAASSPRLLLLPTERIVRHPADVLAVTLTLVVAIATCAFASYNHVLAYRRTTAFSRQIAILAARDGLTGCLNHRTFHERLQAEALVADHAHPLSLLILDVDDFKTVNDTHGHLAGDQVLHEVGRVLAELCRADDAAGRLGGDEFALLLPATPRPGARLVAERACAQIRRTSIPCAVTVSIGVAVTTSRGDTAGLLAAADHAVYAAKRAGRDQVACADHVGTGLGTTLRP